MRSPQTLFRALAGLLTVAFTASAVPAVCALAQVDCCEAEAVVEMACCDEETTPEPAPVESVCGCSDTIMPATAAPELTHVAAALPGELPWSHTGRLTLVLDSASEAPRGHGPPPYLLSCRFLI